MANKDKSRRDFVGMALGAWAAIGGLGVLYAAKRTWDPLPSVKAAGFTTIDLSAVKPNELNVEKWRGKPIFVLKHDQKMLSALKEEEKKRLIKVGNDHFLITIGLCTHLGCIPAYKSEETKFKCACHGGEFDVAGVEIFGPPPSPLVIPPFKIEGTKVVLGEEGPEYKKMKEAGLVA